MTQYTYNIPSKATYSYEVVTRDFDGLVIHSLFLNFTWISPVTNKEHVEKLTLREDADLATFYKTTEPMFNKTWAEIDMRKQIAKVLKEELSSEVDFLEVAKRKFEERLKTEFDIVVYVDLERAEG